MVEEIRSAEKVTVPTVGQGPAPKHTHEGHERCAYYFGDPEGVDGVYCHHLLEARGALYSEDYVRELRIAAQALIAELGTGVGPPMNQRSQTVPLIARLRELVS